jgi:hypothetical protein
MVDDKKTNEEDTANPKEPEKYYFEVWKYYEQVAMHFNDLIIKLRVQSIGGIAAIATILGIFLKGNSDNNCASFNYCLGAIALLVLMIFWLAIYCLDMKYYNRLLEGSVNAILELEKKKSFLEKEGIKLSTNIENAFSKRFEHEEKSWFKRNFYGGRNGFYLYVLIGLFIPFIICVFMIWKSNPTIYEKIMNIIRN